MNADLAGGFALGLMFGAAGDGASREELIEAARTMIAAKREAEQAVLDEVRRLAREHGLRP